MKKLILLSLGIAALCMTVPVSAQKIKLSGKTTTEIREVPSFSGIVASTGVDVFLTQGKVREVKVKTDTEMHQYVKTEVKDGSLHVYLKNSKPNNKKKHVAVNVNKPDNVSIAVYVTIPEIEKLSASSGADIKAGNISGEELKITASSAGDIKAIVDYQSVKISASSGADVELKGYAKHCKASASSGADIDLKDMECHVMSASASSGADINVYATESLNASASSGADITYYGNPESVSKSSSSGGSIKHRNKK